MEIEELELQNIWWKESIEKDFHLQKLKNKRFIYQPSILNLEELKKEKSGIYTIIGPRQIGKTTYLKLIVRELLKTYDPFNILYFSCENINKEKLKEAILFFLKEIAKGGKKFIFLDEVSLVEDWEIVELELYNKGMLDEVIIVNTGSSSLNLKKSSERLPGRKGKGRLFYFFPLSFRDFVFLLNEQADKIDSKPFAFLDTLNELLIYYIEASGFPEIINQYFEGSIDDSKYDIYKDWIEGDIVKAKRSVNFSYQIFSKILENLTSQLNWESIAKNTTIKSHSTIAEYIDLFDSLFIIKVVNLIGGDMKIRLSKNKKIYFFDHFLISVIEKSILKINNYFEYYKRKIKEPEYLSKIVENLVFSNLILITLSFSGGVKHKRK